MEKNNISGTFKVFGTPAEKTSMGKNIMGREGLFENLDACISWHPSDETSADRFISIQIRCNNQTSHTFEGVSVYNAMPWGGYNALHALELMDIAVQFVKDCVVPVSSYPIISSILNKEYADYAVSSIPGVAKATYVSRALTRRENEMIQKRLFDCANGAALALGVTVKNEVLTGTWEPVPNHVLAHAAHKNIEVIGGWEATIRVPQPVWRARSPPQAPSNRYLESRSALRRFGGLPADVGVPEARSGRYEDARRLPGRGVQRLLTADAGWLVELPPLRCTLVAPLLPKPAVVEHLTELRRRLMWSLATTFAPFVACFWFAEPIYDLLLWPYRLAAGVDAPIALIYTRHRNSFLRR